MSSIYSNSSRPERTKTMSVIHKKTKKGRQKKKRKVKIKVIVGAPEYRFILQINTLVNINSFIRLSSALLLQYKTYTIFFYFEKTLFHVFASLFLTKYGFII